MQHFQFFMFLIKFYPALQVGFRSCRLSLKYEGLQCKTRCIHFVNFSGRAPQTVVFMAFCIETQTLKGILTAIYFVFTSEILPAGAGQGEEEFSAENACV